MSQLFTPGTQIKTIFGGTVKIVKKLGEGGEGVVYLVDFDGQQKALKWYRKTYLDHLWNAKLFYEHLRYRVTHGSPDPALLWPLDLTEWQEGSFGYVMDLYPEGFFCLSDFLWGRQKFQSFDVLCAAAARLVRFYRNLHTYGYVCPALDLGYLLINPKTGKIVVCDDQIFLDGASADIAYNPRLAAPELVTGQSQPDTHSDRYTLSVFLFLMFFHAYPLEGKRYLVPALTPELQKKLYGSDSLFILDSEDSSNGPHPTLHKNLLMLWQEYPEFLRKAFLTAFSQDALHNPRSRLTERQWMAVLKQYHDFLSEA